MRALRSLLPVCLALGCAPPPPASPAATAPVQATAASPTATPGGWTAVDPRAVRCGVDDGPRSVGSRSGPGDAAARGLLAARPLLEVAPRRARRRPATIDLDDGSPTPVYIERLPPEFIAGPAQTELADALKGINPDYEACSALLTEPVSPGQVSFDLELGTSGAPLRVEPTADGAVGPFQRCLMERVCQLNPRVQLARPTRVRIPLKLSPTPPR